MDVVGLSCPMLGLRSRLELSLHVKLTGERRPAGAPSDTKFVVSSLVPLLFESVGVYRRQSLGSIVCGFISPQVTQGHDKCIFDDEVKSLHIDTQNTSFLLAPRSLKPSVSL